MLLRDNSVVIYCIISKTRHLNSKKLITEGIKNLILLHNKIWAYNSYQIEETDYNSSLTLTLNQCYQPDFSEVLSSCSSVIFQNEFMIRASEKNKLCFLPAV